MSGAGLALTQVRALLESVRAARRQFKAAHLSSRSGLTYLKLTEMKGGLLISFGAPLIKDGILRLANGLAE